MKMFTLHNFTFLFLLLASNGIARNSITPNQPLKDSGETIISPSGLFVIGFFNLGTRRYLGIRYHGYANNTIIWVANRNTPLNDTSGILTLTLQGTLLLTTSNTTKIWRASVSTTTSSTTPIARLLDTGNLVVGDYLWESFDYPGNTIMPNMTFGKNLVTGLNKYLSSWKADDDPSEGSYTYRLDPSGYPQIFLRNGSDITFRSGPWDGERFSGMANMKPNPIYTYEFVMNEKEIYYRFDLIDSRVLTRLMLRETLDRLTWAESTGGWVLYSTIQMDPCDRFNLCGPYGTCNINNSPSCECLDGFEPKDPNAYWYTSDWKDGCVRRVKLECRTDGFKRISGLKLPDTRKVYYDKSLSLKECHKLCTKNCSCTAFSNSDVRNGGSGCFMWFDELIDIRFDSDPGQDLYVRMAASELGHGSSAKEKASILVPVLSVVLVVIFLWLKFHKRQQKKHINEGTIQCTVEQDLELPLFSFAEINKATEYFSLGNKLGEGGFGLVYKGILDDGQEIAVKRLSKNSNQGINEFKNEASCIVKLQHRNLVKLLGCCIHEEEKLLIYEYMPYKSLDLLIFDKTKSNYVDLQQRLNIINGIARGLLYLHQDSRLRIIHRDLKASNILLDHHLNPKISDFGMARIFGGDEIDQANTDRIVGTYGYMAPEYATDGEFSVKSDVFSFGVLVLEIVSGKKNRAFNHPDHDLNLLGHAWILHNEGRSTDLVGVAVKESGILAQVLRTIHVGLLCVQQSPQDRPTMSMVVLMFGSNIPLPYPKHPGFFTERKFINRSLLSTVFDTFNEISVTSMDGR